MMSVRYSLLVAISDRDAFGNVTALLEELRHASAGCAQLLDLLIQRAALGIGDGAGRILRLDLIIDERIEQELFTHVLEEVLVQRG